MHPSTFDRDSPRRLRAVSFEELLHTEDIPGRVPVGIRKTTRGEHRRNTVLRQISSARFCRRQNREPEAEAPMWRIGCAQSVVFRVDEKAYGLATELHYLGDLHADRDVDEARTRPVDAPLRVACAKDQPCGKT